MAGKFIIASVVGFFYLAIAFRSLIVPQKVRTATLPLLAYANTASRSWVESSKTKLVLPSWRFKAAISKPRQRRKLARVRSAVRKTGSDGFKDVIFLSRSKRAGPPAPWKGRVDSGGRLAYGKMMI
jgi:hypothetical protein